MAIRSQSRFRRRLFVVLGAVALMLVAASPAAAADLLVKFRGDVSAGAADRALAAHDARSLRAIEGIGVRVVSVPGSRLAAIRASLAADPRVLFAEGNPVAEPQETVPDDPYFPRGTYSIQSGAWGWYQTHTTQAWDLTTGAPGTVIAILDTGLKPEALDFGGRLVPGYNVLDGSTDTVTNAGNHGTYVAGVAGLAINTASGGAGYCPDCRIMPVQVGTDSGATYANMAAGITWAVDHGARVVNLSWAGTNQSSTLAEAVAYARAKGAVVFAAAGNSNCDCPTYPSATPGVMGVAGVAMSGAKAGDSNYGTWVDLAAPEGNMTAWPSINGAPGYAPVGGTSVSSPAAAGIAGLLFSAVPGLSGEAAERALEDSATPLGFAVAHGEVDAMAALRSLGLADPQAAGAPVNTVSPSVLVETNGDEATAPLAAAPQPGQVLVRGQGAWRGSAPLSLSGVKWYRCNPDGGACSQVGSSWKYAVKSEDTGFAIKLAVTFTDPDGGTVAAAPLTEPVGGSAPPPPPPPPPPPATQTLTFSGSLTNKATSRSYQVAVGAGLAAARLSFSACKSLSLTLKSATGATVAGVSGPSILALDQNLAAGSYTYVVSGSGRCSFTLTVSSPAP
ncbi:MAG TPA: S8 family serine peptidase [Solirubrobacterales bacterium]|nr:S8 family serine peptidase [Solirubrobacterales bacterium]